ncbi:acid phosphatase type 7-like [Glandiceps talaboti]
MESRLLVTILIIGVSLIESSCGDVLWGNSILDFTKFNQDPVVGLHLALASPSSVTASWLNIGKFKQGTQQPPICAYGAVPDGFTAVAAGESYTYTAGDFDSTLNKVTFDIGNIGDVVYYRCSNPSLGGWSPLYNFTILPGSLTGNADRQKVGHNRPKYASPSAKIALIADLGIVNGVNTAESIAKHVESGEVQLVVHAGDISYADDFSLIQHNNSFVWTEYMAMIQPFSARVPYMVGPGNHEAQFGFAAYKNWFHMPHNISQSSSPFYYSFDYMGVHFVAISTEHDFSQGSAQYNWLENDLKKADSNRNEVPWVFVHGHRPLYCSDLVTWATRCTGEATKYRANIEDLLYKYNVDIYMAGHNHQYERSYPVYKKQVTSKNYNNPQATVYIVNGAAGNPEPNDPTYVPISMAPWRANEVTTFHSGWMLMEVNATALDFTYLFSETGEVKDRFTIIKDSH